MSLSFHSSSCLTRIYDSPFHMLHIILDLQLNPDSLCQINTYYGLYFCLLSLVWCFFSSRILHAELKTKHFSKQRSNRKKTEEVRHVSLDVKQTNKRTKSQAIAPEPAASSGTLWNSLDIPGDDIYGKKKQSLIMKSFLHMVLLNLFRLQPFLKM